MTRSAPWNIAAAIIVPVALLVALLAWALASPPGATPDEDYHMGSIWCAAGAQEGICEEAAPSEFRLLPADVVTAAACFAFDPNQSASCPTSAGEMLKTKRGNWVDHSYPPIFYSVMHVFASDNLPASVLAMRAANAVICVGLLTSLFFLLPIRRRPVLVLGSLIGIVPLGMFLIPSLNPSGWAILQATGLWIAVWGYFATSGKRKFGLGAVAFILMVIGAGARGDAALYGVLALIVASILSFQPTRRFAVELTLPLVLAAIAVILFLSSGQSGVVTADTPEYAGSLLTLLSTNLQMLPQLWVGAFGFWALGWIDTRVPELVWVTSFALFSSVVFWGLRVGDVKKWLSLAGIASALIVVPLYILMREGIVVGTGVQPRYLYPLLIMLAAVSLVGLTGVSLGLGRVQLVVTAAGLTMANSLALHINLRRYVTGTDNAGLNLDRDIEWWWESWLSPMGVWAIGTAALAMALGALVAIAWTSAGREVSYAVSEQNRVGTTAAGSQGPLQ